MINRATKGAAHSHGKTPMSHTKQRAERAGTTGCRPYQRITGRWGARAATVVAVLCVVTPAYANGGYTFDFALTLGQNPSALNATLFNPRLGLGIPASRYLQVNLDWGLTNVSLPVATADEAINATQSETRFTNPYVEVCYHFQIAHEHFDFNFGVSLGMAMPVADANAPNQAAAYRVALSSVGAWDPWLYIPNTLGFAIPMQAEFLFNDFALMVDSSVFLLIPTEDTNQRSTQFGPQVGIEGTVPVGKFELGARLQLVQAGDNAQNEGRVHTSIVPLLRLLIDPVVVESRFTLNLGTGGGDAFGTAGTWGLTVGLGIVVFP